MAKYRVKPGHSVTCEAGVLLGGATLELTAKQAEAMPWAVELVEAPAPPPPPAPAETKGKK